jgi:hypothetical protein
MAQDVFISHSAKDKTIADAVCATLESEGIRCWIAPRDVTPGREFGKCIMEAIKQVRIMVLVFTANANASAPVCKEIERAVNHDVIILPFRVENVIPDESLEYFIGNVHWLDAVTPPIEAHFRNLAKAIKILLAPIETRDNRDEDRQAGPNLAPLPEASRPEVSDLAPVLEVAPRSKGPVPTEPVAVMAAPVFAAKAPASYGAKTAAAGPQAGSFAAVASPEPAKGHSKSSSPDSGAGRAIADTPKPRKGRFWVLGGAIALALVLAAIFAVRSRMSPTPARAPSQGARPGATPQELAGEANRLILQKRYSEAKPLAEQACDGGSADGCDNLGLLYEHGWGVARDYAQAHSFYEKACDGGSAIGCSNLGVLYENGLGVARDFTQAVALFKKACDGGSAYGCGNLGWMNQNGRGVAQDYGQAASLYEKACDGGDANSCGSLGSLYEKGLGVTQDTAKGKSLLQKACSAGNRFSCDELKKLQ